MKREVSWTDNELAIYADLVALAHDRTGRDPTEEEVDAMIKTTAMISTDPDALATTLQ